ncbi:RHS repeat-associated core domain-containing protein [Amycolatopsis sacchari]|uniref:RHS repeat-associated core domain-containing protein n=1 Tax=Amycolatopsis sacchari TaxID=115433 RepID=UPI003D70AABC
MSNPLVAQEQSSTKAYSGVSLLETAFDLDNAIKSGDWAAVALGAVGTALDALSMAMDPFGAILAAGVGWLMEHVGPLKEALDALAGDPDRINAHSETWGNVAKELGEIAQDLTSMVQADLQGWTGPAADSYRALATDTGNLLSAAQQGADGASSGIKTAGEVVAAVRALVRDIIAELIGHLISWALQVLFTLGIASAWVVPQVIAEVAKVSSKIADLTKRLVKALKALGDLLKRAGELFGKAGKAFRDLKVSGKSTPGKPADLGPAPRELPKDLGGKTEASSAGPTPHGAAGGDNPPPPPRTDPGGDTTTTSGATGGSSSTGGSRSGSGGGSSNGLRGQGDNPKSLDPDYCEFDPIDVVSGRLVMTETDFVFLGALPLVFTRSHFSGFRTGRFLGTAWMSTVDQRVEADGTGASFAADDGTLQRYPVPVTDDWVAAERGPRRLLARTGDGGYLLDDQEREQLLYFAPGPDAALLAWVADRNGNRYEILRTDEGVPVELRHTAGHLIRFEADGGLVTAAFSVAADGTQTELVRYGYTGSRLTSVTNASGRPFRYDYDTAGRIVAWTDRNDEWYRYAYDSAGRVVRTEGAGGFLTGTLEYDSENRVTRTTDALGHRKEYHLNEAGQVVREVDPLGHATVSERDEHDRLLSRTDPLGRTTRYRYDERGNLVAEIRPDGSERLWERDAAGRPLAETTAPGVVTRYGYDERGNLTEIVAPDGGITRYRLDERGLAVAITDAAGATSLVEYDAAGLPVAETDPLGATTRYERDAFGRIVAVTDPLGAVERYGYTVDGKLAWHRFADGSQEQWLFDGEGNNRAHTGPTGAVTRGEFTHFDLPSAQIAADGTRVAFGYDPLLRITGVTNEQGRVWRYEYDAAGNLVRETDFAGAVTTFAYDAAGQLVERVRPDGQRATFRYDPAGNLVEQAVGDVVTRFEVSAAGYLMAADDGTTRVEFERDAAGRVLAETINGRTVRSAYDAEGRRVRRVTPSGAESAWEYDAAGLPVAVHLSGRSLRFAHDPAGREVRRTLGGGATLTQTWTPESQLASQAVADQAGRLAQQRAYAYRADGMLTGLRDQQTGPRDFTLDVLGRVTGVRAPHWSESYTYDAAGNLTDASWPTTEADLLGRRTLSGPLITAAGGMRYGHDRRGRVVLRERALPGGAKLTWRFSWNDEDRLTEVVVPDGSTWRYTYDPFGRRVAKEHLAADGRTVLERVEFTWDGQVLAEQASTGPQGVQATVWDYEPDDFRPLAQRERAARPGQSWVDERFHAIVADLTGSPAELVDDRGGITWCGRTSVHGAPAGPAAAEPTPLRFPGQYFDAETGLHYTFQRYYDPVPARFLSPDPLGLEPGPNPYAYVANPYVLIDPLGLAPGSCSGGTSSSSAGTKRPHGLSINTNVPPTGPHNSPGGRLYDQSPGGTWYQQLSPAGKNKDKKNRVAAGMKNPPWHHGNMLPMWQNALVNQPPPGLKGPKLKEWMDKHGQYQSVHQDGTPDRIISRPEGVMGHNKAAGTYWNETGHKLPFSENQKYNKQASSYHGIEYEKSSAATGSREDRYNAPTPGQGSNKMYYNRNDPRFIGGPWPSYQPVGGLPAGSRPVDGTPAPTPTTAPPAKKPRYDSDSDD